jgi:hypothetical protein
LLRDTLGLKIHPGSCLDPCLLLNKESTSKTVHFTAEKIVLDLCKFSFKFIDSRRKLRKKYK